MTKNEENLIANESIRATNVRLVGQDTTTIVPTYEAIRRARKVGLDLVQIAVGDIPICRIIDLDRHRFERAKEQREAARRQRELQVEVKEIQLRPVTGDADIAVKAKRSRQFLDDGNKVRIVVRYRGRERVHRDEGRRVVECFLAALGEHKVDSPLRDGDRDATMVLSPVVSKADLAKSKDRRPVG